MELVLKRENGLHGTILIVGLLVALLVCPDAALAKRPMAVKIGRGEAKVTALQGTAKAASEGGKWRSLKVGNVLKGGDQVTTGADSRLEVTLPDNSFLRFAENASFKIVQIDMSADAGTRNARVNVALGKTWANVSKTFGVKPGIEVACENAVTGVRGTIYRMNVNDDQSALVRVYEGEVAVSGGGKPMEQPVPGMGPPEKISGPVSVPGPRKVTMEEWVEIVRAMQQISVSATGVPGKPRPFTAEEDKEDWVDWNKQRDAETGSQDEPRQGETGNSGFFNWFR